MKEVLFSVGKQQRHAYICNMEKLADSGPVALALHGAGGNPFLFKMTSRLDQAVSRYGATIYLSSQRSGKMPRWQLNDSSDRDFLLQVIDQICRMGKRVEDIFLIGMSNGGCLAHQLGLTAGLPLGGIASVCAAVPQQHDQQAGNAADISRPLTPSRILLVNALHDPIVPFYNDIATLGQTDLLGHYESVAAWKTRLGVDEASIVQSPASSEILSIHDASYSYYESADSSKRLMSLCISRKVHAWELLCENPRYSARESSPRRLRARMQNSMSNTLTTSRLIAQYLFDMPKA